MRVDGSIGSDAARAREELANTLTAAVGALASLAAGPALLAAAPRTDRWTVAGVAVFAFSLLLLHTASTLYHAARAHAAKRRLRVLDHCAIYVLIAGTYTPFVLGPLRGPFGWTLCATVWTLALAGVVFELFCTGRFPRLSTALYLALGWLVVAAAGPFLRALAPPVVLWLVAGGLAYTGGTLLSHSRRIRYAHAWWHLLVLVGSACHFVAVLLQLLPRAV